MTTVTQRVYGPYRGTLWALAGVAAYTLLVGALGSGVWAAIRGSRGKGGGAYLRALPRH